LLSSNNIRNVVGLPVIPTVSGSFVSLSQQDATPKIYTLLETAEVEVFKLCDENAISLDNIPPSSVRLFREQASYSLNVKWLSPDQVVRYLGLHPTRRGLQLSQDEADNSAVTFLSKFWTWLDGWDHRSLLLTKLESEPVLPCVGGLRRALRSQPVFDAIGIDPALLACLSGLGVPFLSSTLDPEARDILARYGFLKPATEMHALLDAVTTVGGSMSDQDAQLLFDHFNRYMVNSTWYSFSERQKTAFRKLPIFPIVEHDTNVSQRRRRAAVQRFSVYGLQSFELLPVLPNTVFVDVNVNALDHRLLPLLNESEHRFLSDMEVLDLCVNRLDQQPKKLLARMLQHIANASHRDGLTSLLLQSLRSEKYAYSLKGTREAPQTLIDPSSPLYSLYANDNQRLHSLKDAEERSIADSLSRLGLLDKALSAHNITDRIDYIASSASFEDAVELLNIIYEHGFNCHSLTLDESAQWLPTQNGTLATAAECRPGKGSASEERHLFDKVLELVHSRAVLSPSLRTVLGWDDPVPMDVLLRQFGEVLDHPDDDVYHRVKNLIKELSNRQLSLTTSQWSSVRLLLEDRSWVPTSEYTLVESWQAVFSSSFQGIYTVAPDLSKIGSESREFLTKLDCLPT
jgi:sacsin